MDRRFAAFAFLAAACLPDPGVPLPDPEDVAAVSRAFQASRPEGPLSLVLDLPLYLPDDEACPILAVDESDGREVWTGGCFTEDGLLVDGSLERFEGGDTAWMAGNRFRVIDPRQGDVLLSIDGAVEVAWYGDLVVLDASLATCGGPGLPCTPDGPATVDLALTLYPWRSYPSSYEVTVNGLVDVAEDEPVAVYGMWRGEESCVAEPSQGTLALEAGRPFGLAFDGAVECDECALLAVDGQPTAHACTSWLP
ncbi:MAG: hypothetical protein JXB39_06900 [Deltaproteobacteria bacterium]|nr:hypothetical protein [Deltaproteobacteria bacterium]